MKILHIAYVDSRSDSGISVVVPRHLEHQSKHADVSLLNIIDFNPSNSEGVYSVYSVERGDRLSSVLSGKDRPDLVVFHEIYRPYFIRAYKELLSEKIPYVIIPHGSLTQNAQLESKWKKRIGNLVFFSQFTKMATAIQYMSETEKKHTIVRGGVSFTQGSGIDIIGHQKESFSKKEFKIIYIGRLDMHVKGLDIILEAVRIYKEAFQNHGVFVTIAGSDSKGGVDWMRTYINKYGLNSLIALEGPVYGDAKTKKLLESDLFVQLSRTEAQCLGLMEAMDLGLPAIVTPGSTFYEIGEKYGVAIPVTGNGQEVGSAILSAISNKRILTKMSPKASRYIATNYEWSRVGRLMVDHYERIVHLEG